MNKQKFNIDEMSRIEVEALFLQYNVGNRDALDRELLYAMIDWLKKSVLAMETVEQK